MRQGRLSPSPAIPPHERPPKKPKHSGHTAQLSIPAPPPGPPIDPDVATDFNLPNPPPSNTRPTLGLWGKDALLHSTPLNAYEVVDDFTNTKAPVPQVSITSADVTND